jgi:hypothetical protein
MPYSCNAPVSRTCPPDADCSPCRYAVPYEDAEVDLESVDDATWAVYQREVTWQRQDYQRSVIG